MTDWVPFRMKVALDAAPEIELVAAAMSLAATNAASPGTTAAATVAASAIFAFLVVFL
jgi:hypothetical protein